MQDRQIPRVRPNGPAKSLSYLPLKLAANCPKAAEAKAQFARVAQLDLMPTDKT